MTKRMTTAALLLAGSLLAIAGCGADSGTAAAPPAGAAGDAVIRNTGATATTNPDGALPGVLPGATPTPTRPKGDTVNPRPVPWTSAKPTSGGRKIKIVWWSGVEPCYVLDRVKVKETRTKVTLTLYEGSARSADSIACIELAVQKTTTVKLKSPLGKRKIVDGAKKKASSTS
jgi:DMSO/TMAO reductase YedYZ molybdopterin-dependent catalytic subunit